MCGGESETNAKALSWRRWATNDEASIAASAGLDKAWYAGTGPQLYHHKARAYLPTLGRFAQTDPIGFGGGMNLYAYVGNDPVNWTDPWGLAHNPNIQCIDCIVVTGQRNSPTDPDLMDFLHGGSISGGNYYIAAEYRGEERAERREEEGEIVVTGQACVTLNGACVADWGVDDATFDFAFLFFTELKGLGVLDDIARAFCGGFVEGTMVATPEGLRAIEDIAVGDQVLAWDPELCHERPLLSDGIGCEWANI